MPVSVVSAAGGFFQAETVNNTTIEDLVSAVQSVENSVTSCATNATAAAASASAAASSASAAASSESGAAADIAACNTSATNAANSATSAASSATTATTQATSATSSASAAATSATNAAASATTASSAATAAGTSETNAASSATAAATSASSAATSASNASAALTGTLNTTQNVQGLWYFLQGLRTLGGSGINGDGSESVQGIQISTVGGSNVALAAAGQYVATATIAGGNGGTGYLVNDIVYEPVTGTKLLVTGVSGGAITTMSIQVKGFATTIPATANLVGGTGSGAVVTMTSGNVANLSLACPSGGQLILTTNTGGYVVIQPTLTNAANDGAAATAGVPLRGLYRNGSIVMQRVS